MIAQKKHNNYELILNFFTKLEKSEFTYIYNGQLNAAISDHIISLDILNTDKTDQPSRMKKRVFSVVVESLQNVTRHNEDTEENDEFFAIQLIKGFYYVTTVNLIHNENIEKIDTFLKKIQGANPDELKKLYQETLENNVFSSKGGAGLGLLEIARKTNNKIYYNFQKINDLYSYFYFHPYVGNSDDEIEEKSRAKNVTYLHNLIVKNQVHTLFSGLFDQSILINLLSITDEQMSAKGSRRKIFSLMIEMIQNITKYGYSDDREKGNQGAFFINTQNNQFTLNSGNLVLNSDIEELKEKIEYVNSLDNKQLDELYNKRLLNFQNEEHHSAGLGLIDIRIKSNNKLTFDFFPINKTTSLFVLQVQLD